MKKKVSEDFKSRMTGDDSIKSDSRIHDRLRVNLY